MAKNTDKSSNTKKEQSPPKLPPVTKPVTQLRGIIKKDETKQVDNHKNTDK